MNPSKKNTEQSIRETLLQHEFEVEAGMWADMEQKLDQGNASGSGLWKGFRKGWFLLAILILLFVPAVLWWTTAEHVDLSVTQKGVSDQPAISSNLAATNEPIIAPDLDENTKQRNIGTDFKTNPNKAFLNENNNPSISEKGVTEQPLTIEKQANIKNNKAKATKANGVKKLDSAAEISTQGLKPVSEAIQENLTTVLSDELATAPNLNIKNEQLKSPILLDSISAEKEFEQQDGTGSFTTPLSRKFQKTVENTKSLERPLTVLENPFVLLDKDERDESESLKKWWKSYPKFISKPSHWSFGAKAGILIPYISSINPLNTEEALSWENNSTYFLQATTAYQVNDRLTLETGLKYSKVPYSYNLDYLDSNGNQVIDRTEQHINQLDIPLIANFHLNRSLYFSGGLGNAFRKVSSPFEKLFGVEHVDKLYKITNNLYKPSLSFWQAGIGLHHASWSLEANYQRYFGSTMDDFDFEEEHFMTDTKEWNLNVALVYNIKPKRNYSLTKPREIKKLKRFFWGAGFALGRSYFSSSNSVSDLNLLIWDDFSTYKLNTLLYFQLNKRFHLQTELWYHKSNLSYEVDPALSSDPFNASDVLKINSFEIPIILHYRAFKNFRLAGGLGLQFNFLKTPDAITYPSNPEYASFYNSIPESFKRQVPFYDIGLGFDWKQFAIDLRFRNTIGPFVDGVVYDEVSYEIPGEAYLWFLGVNYIFGRE